MTWGDLEKFGLSSRVRPDGGVMLIVSDARPIADIVEGRLVSTLAAMSKIARAKYALVERYQGKGVVAYVTKGTPPPWFNEAVSASGGVVFDGAREQAHPSPRAATLILDEAFCDLAIATRRRLKVRSFRDALELREAELRRAPLALDNPLAYWSAAYELMALTGEILRTDQPGRYTFTDQARVPIALDMGQGRLVLLGRVAEAITAGAGGSMTTFLSTAQSWLAQASEPKSTTDAYAIVPYLLERDRVSDATMTWELLVSPETDTRWMPVIGYARDRGDALQWGKLGPIDDALRARARHSLDTARLVVDASDLGDYRLGVVEGEYAAEAILHRPTMQKLVLEVGSELMIIGIPARGHLFAVNAALNDEMLNAFFLLIEKLYLEAPEALRLTTELIVYQGQPLGSVQSGFMEARRLLRLVGQDPDALDEERAK